MPVVHAYTLALDAWCENKRNIRLTHTLHFQFDWGNQS